MLFGQEILVDRRYDKQTVYLTVTLDGLEVCAPDGKMFLLPSYRKFCNLTNPDAFTNQIGWTKQARADDY